MNPEQIAEWTKAQQVALGTEGPGIIARHLLERHDSIRILLQDQGIFGPTAKVEIPLQPHTLDRLQWELGNMLAIIESLQKIEHSSRS